MALLDHNATRYSLTCDDVMIRSTNRSWVAAPGADLVDAPLRFLSSDTWMVTRAGVAVCLAVASLIANRLLLLDVLCRQLADNDIKVTGTKPSYYYTFDFTY